jgi:DNA polymerase I-like protein with 3'-5' exonuclease and polymerase domains
MLEAFETGKDVHSLTASIFFNKPVELISNEDGSSSLGNGMHSERFWGKKGNHSLNYRMGLNKLADELEITFAESKFLNAQYFAGYPGVPAFHGYIKESLNRPNGGWLTNLLGTKFRFLGPFNDSVWNEGCACIPQSTVADLITQYGMIPIFYLHDDEFKIVKLYNAVYDSLEIAIPRSVPIQTHASILYKIKKNLEIPLTFETESITIPADISVGLNYGAYHETKNPLGQFDLNSPSKINPIEDLVSQLEETNAFTL